MTTAAEHPLIHLEPADGHDPIADCAARFRGGQMVFDSIPHRASRSVTRLEFG
ncbi:MAG: hypothetical protein ACRDUT_11925 [Mycobacterium sp.]